jgi:FkbM family methyltransferase
MKKLQKTLSDLLNLDMGKRKPIRVIFRFLILQIRKRITSSPIVFSTCVGTKAFVQKGIDTTGSAGLFYTGILEFQEVVYLWHLLREGNIFFDIGANQGAWGLILSAKGVTCHELEPSSETYKNLIAQINLQNSNILSRLNAHQLACSSKNGVARFSKGLGQANHLVINMVDDNSEEVQTITLDTLTEKFGCPTAIKIDTEGFTKEVIESGDNTLSNPTLRAIVIETFRFANGLDKEHLEIEKKLKSYGFLPYYYDPEQRQLNEIETPLEGRQDTIYSRLSADDLSKIKQSIPINCFGIDF